MTLLPPAYVAETGAIGAPITHSWDDDDPGLAYLQEDERLRHRIRVISPRGILTLSGGFAEWVAWRMQPFDPDPMLLDKIEAVYAASIDFRFWSGRPTPPRGEWQGPVRGPMWAAADLLDQIIDLTRRNQFASPETVCLSFLALHVLPDTKLFKNWRRFVIGRLAKFHPDRPGDALGTPVPRNALDPQVPYSPEAADALVVAFIQQLQPSSNPFLNPADDGRQDMSPSSRYGESG
jgi:hypothetical protein